MIHNEHIARLHRFAFVDVWMLGRWRTSPEQFPQLLVRVRAACVNALEVAQAGM